VGAVFCIYDQGFKKQNMNNAFAMLMLFDEQKHQYFARRHSLRSLFEKQKKPFNRKSRVLAIFDANWYIGMQIGLKVA